PLEVDGWRHVTKPVVVRFERTIFDGDDAKSGGVVANRPADGPGGDHLERAVTAVRVAMVVAGIYVLHTVLMKQGQQAAARFERKIEVLFRFLGVLEKQRLMQEHDEMLD